MDIPRRLREWYPNATYHLMERGIRRQKIFEDEMDYQVFKEIMRVAMDKYSCTVHAYCLMSNHFHILLETDDIEVSAFMKYLASSYAIYFNKKYRYSGHVFEGRYKSCLVKDDTYFLQTSRYIHLNPVKARMVSTPEEYKWSSYRTMISLTDDQITYVGQTWNYFKDNPIIRYREFIEDIGHKYTLHEDKIQKEIGENDLWLPW